VLSCRLRIKHLRPTTTSCGADRPYAALLGGLSSDLEGSTCHETFTHRFHSNIVNTNQLPHAHPNPYEVLPASFLISLLILFISSFGIIQLHRQLDSDPASVRLDRTLIVAVDFSS